MEHLVADHGGDGISRYPYLHVALTIFSQQLSRTVRRVNVRNVLLDCLRSPADCHGVRTVAPVFLGFKVLAPV